MKHVKIVPESEATHMVDEANLKPLTQTVDLSMHEGDTVHLFEFIDEPRSGGRWCEGYLLQVKNEKFYKACKLSGEVKNYTNRHNHIRYQTDRWYPWFGGDCPLPEGVMVEVWLQDKTGGTTHVTALNWSNTARNHITTYRITGLADGWRYPNE